MPAPSSAAIRSGHVCAKIRLIRPCKRHYRHCHRHVTATAAKQWRYLDAGQRPVHASAACSACYGQPTGGYYSSGVEPRIRGVREKRLFLISLKDEERGQFT